MRRLLIVGPLGGLVAFAGTLPASFGGARPLVTVLIVHVVAGVVAGWLLSLASLGSVGARLRFVLLLATFGALAAFGVRRASGQLATLPAALLAGRLALGWALGGLVLAWRLAPPPPRETVELPGAPLGRPRHPNA